MVHYFNFYTADDFAKKLGYKDGDEMFKYWFSKKTKLTEFNLINWCMASFEGIYAEDLADEYDYEHQAYLDAEDAKYDRLAGK